MAEPRQAFVGIGSNLGDRLGTLQRAIARLRGASGVKWVEPSSVYATEPVGLTAQPEFLNLVAGLETTLAPEALLSELQAIEHEFGRVRTQRWGPRTLDLDLLVFEGETRASAALTLPHPRMFERAFVLVPLGELLGCLPFTDSRWNSLRETLREIAPRGGVQRLSDREKE